jgi:hypothetical protein
LYAKNIIGITIAIIDISTGKLEKKGNAFKFPANKKKARLTIDILFNKSDLLPSV